MTDVTTGAPHRPPATLTRLYTRLQATREPIERSLIGRIVLRFDIIDGSDRAAVLALNALLSLIPLAVLGVAVAHVYGVTSGNYADGLADVLNLHGRTARYVHDASASVNDSIRSATVVGIGGLLWTAFGFTSALWRVYDRAWGGHSHAGPRAWLRGFAWLVLFSAGHTIVALTRSELGPRHVGRSRGALPSSWCSASSSGSSRPRCCSGAGCPGASSLPARP